MAALGGQGSSDAIFEKALSRFRISLTNDEKTEFRLSTLDDLMITIDQIQKYQGSQKKLQNLARLQGFIEAMKQCGEVIEVFLNVSSILAFVWGPIKFLLKVE